MKFMQETRKIENHEILTVFRQLSDSYKDVRLLNVYKGVPISYEAKIIEVADQSALFRTEKYQIVCLDYEGKTHVQSLFLPKIVIAKVHDIDILRNESVLGDFEYTSGRIGARTQVRVMPEKTIEGLIRVVESPQSFPGELADISLDGLGFFTHVETLLPENFQKSAKVTIELYLPGVRQKKSPQQSSKKKKEVAKPHHTIRLDEGNLPCMEQIDWQLGSETIKITVHGEIANIHKDMEHSRHRIGIRIDPGDGSKAEIAHFITHRQAQIMREIKHVYDNLAKNHPLT
jgi:hypothetical protein